MSLSWSLRRPGASSPALVVIAWRCAGSEPAGEKSCAMTLPIDSSRLSEIFGDSFAPAPSVTTTRAHGLARSSLSLRWTTTSATGCLAAGHVMRAAVGEYAGTACFADIDTRMVHSPLAVHDERWRQNVLGVRRVPRLSCAEVGA